MKSFHWMVCAVSFVLGVMVTLGLVRVSTSADSGPDEQARKNSAIRLERDIQSLRQENQNLRNRLASIEGSDSTVVAAEEEIAKPEEEAAYPKSAAELGVYVGQLRKAWDAFSAKFPDGRPAPGDENYDEFMATFQQFASDFAIIGVQMRDIMQYNPEERGAFQASLIGEYLNLDSTSGEKLSGLMTDLNEQMSEAKLDWSHRPEDREEMRAWFETRQAFEAEASKLIKSELPADQQEKYEQAFGDRGLSGSMRDMMRGMGSMMRPGGGRGMGQGGGPGPAGDG